MGIWSLGSVAPENKILIAGCLKSSIAFDSACNFGIENIISIITAIEDDRNKILFFHQEAYLNLY